VGAVAAAVRAGTGLTRFGFMTNPSHERSSS
jgi:hypothetical protein